MKGMTDVIPFSRKKVKVLRKQCKIRGKVCEG